jgi:hypothetical protein
MSCYQPGSLANWAWEIDPGGHAHTRLAIELHRSLEGQQYAVAINVLGTLLVDVLRSAPRSMRQGATEDVVEAIRHHVRESLD